MPRKRLKTIRSYDTFARRREDGSNQEPVQPGKKKKKAKLNLPVSNKDLGDTKPTGSFRRFQQMVEAGKTIGTKQKKKKAIPKIKKKPKLARSTNENGESNQNGDAPLSEKAQKQLTATRKAKKKRKRKKEAAKHTSTPEIKLDNVSDETNSKPQRLRYEDLPNGANLDIEDGKWFTAEKIPFGVVADRPPKLDIKPKDRKTRGQGNKNGSKRKGSNSLDAQESEELHNQVVQALERSINKEKQLEAAEQATTNHNQVEQIRVQAQLAYQRYKKRKKVATE